MRDLNEVTLMGHLGASPSIRTSADGTKFANVSIATSKLGRADGAGKRPEYTEWHRVVFVGQFADIAEKHTRKGSYVLLKGELRTRTYPASDNTEKTVTEIFVAPGTSGHKLSLLDSRSKAEATEEATSDVEGDEPSPSTVQH